MTIKAIVFDMDGVLIEAREWHYDALNRALALFGFSISRYDHLITFDGLPTSKKLEMLTKERSLPAALHCYINELKQAYTMEIIHARCKPTFCHEYALARLRSSKYKIGVASNSIRQTVELMMEKSHLDSYLDVVLSNQDVSHPKPNPEIYITCIQRLEVDPLETLIVEDNAHGVQAARSAGAHVLEVKDPTEVTIDRINDAIHRIEEERNERISSARRR